MLKFIKTKTGHSLLSALGVGAVCGVAACALVLMELGVGAAEVLLLLLPTAALLRAMPRSAVLVGREVGR